MSQTKRKRLNVVLPWLICGLAAGFYCYEYLLRISPSIMVPELMSAFNINATALGNLSAFYFYAYTPMQLPVGVMMDKYGPRNILTFAVLCCALGTALFGSAMHYWVASCGRFMIGFGSAFAFVGVLKLASNWLPPHRFGFIAGLTTTLGMIGAMFGQNALSVMVSQSGWQQTILYSSLFGFLLIPIIWLVIRDQPKHQTEEMMQLASMAKTTSKTTSKTSYAQLYQAMKKVLTNKQIWLNGLVAGLIMLPTTVFAELWGSAYLQLRYGFEPTQAAKAISMIFLGWAIGAPLTGMISDSLKRRKSPLILGSLSALVILATILYCPISEGFLSILLCLFGIVSSVEVVCFAIGRENASHAVSGTAVAFTNFMVVLAGFFQPVVGMLLDKTWDGTLIDGLRVDSLESYQFALGVLPLSLMLALALAFFVKETYCSEVV